MTSRRQSERMFQQGAAYTSTGPGGIDEDRLHLALSRVSKADHAAVRFHHEHLVALDGRQVTFSRSAHQEDLDLILVVMPPTGGIHCSGMELMQVTGVRHARCSYEKFLCSHLPPQLSSSPAHAVARRAVACSCRDSNTLEAGCRSEPGTPVRTGGRPRVSPTAISHSQRTPIA